MTNISQKNQDKGPLEGKKILYLLTQSKWGGAQKYVLDLAKYFAKKNEVHIAFGEAKNKDEKFLAALKEANIKYIEIPYLQREIDFGSDYLAVMEVLKVLNKEKYNLIHLNSSKAGLIGSVASKIYSLNVTNTRLRVVYTAHGFVFNEPLPKFKKTLYTMSEKFSTGLQHMIITVSEADKQSAIANKIVYPGKMIAVHNGIDFDRCNFYSQEEAINKLGLKTDKKYIGTIASFYQTKGYPYLLEAIKILKEKSSNLLNNYNWIFIGDGPEMDNVKKLIKEYQIEDYTQLLGAKDEAYKYLRAFDAFVLPSVKEGLPYTLLEAGLADVPSIATRVGGVEEIIKDKETGLLVSPANPLSLAEAMEKITSDENLSAKLARNNHQNIKDNFNLKDTIKTTEMLYQKMF